MTDRAVVLVTLLVLFGAHVGFGANNDFLALALSTLLMLLAGLSALLLGPPSFTPGLRLAGGFFIACLALGGLQLAPVPQSLAHPFWTWVPGQAVISLDKDATWRELGRLAGLAAAFFIGLQIGQRDGRARLFFRALVTLSLIFAAWAFFDYFTDPTRLFGALRPFHSDRLSGGFLSANVAASCFGMLAIIAGAALRRNLRNFPGGGGADALNAAARSIVVPAVALLFSVGALMLTASRAGIACFILAGLVFAVWEAGVFDPARRREMSRRSILIGAGVAVAVLVIILSGTMFSDRMQSVGTDSADRAVLFSSHWRAFMASPWFGNGLGTFTSTNNSLMTAENWLVLWYQGAAHNVFLQWLEEGGVAGAGAMFACVIVILVVIAGGLSRRRRSRIWLRAVLIASLGVILHGLFDYALEVPSVALQWTLLLGVAAGISTVKLTDSAAG